MNKRQKRKLRRFLWSLVILLIVGAVAFFGKDYLFGGQKTADPVSGDEVQFHFIDVGQADAALIRTAAGDILIDAGMNASEDELKAYLDSQGVDDIAYAVFTHPHEDHIGGADMVLENYNVERVVRPALTADTQVYQRMDELIRAEGAEDIIATPDETFEVGEVKCTILGPIGDDYGDDPNNHSVVLRVEYGETSVLFTGDAELDSEEDMLNRYRFTGELDCDIIKVGHHGSDTSSGKDFIEAVSPDHAVISCGKDNKHGHPKQEIVSRYEALNIPMYRTDLEGDIVFVTHGGEPEKRAA